MEEPEIGAVVIDYADEKWEREPEGWRWIADGLDPRAGFRGLSWENLERIYSPLRLAREQRTPVTEPDNINHPSHYTAFPGVEVIDLTKHLNFCRGNAVKYLSRAGLKDASKELEDLRKALWYVQCEIERVEAQNG